MIVTLTGALVWPVRLRNCAKTVLTPPPSLSWNAAALVNGVKNTPVNVESSLNRIASAVRQASRKSTARLPVCVTLFDVPMAGVSSGSDARKFERTTAPRTVASTSPATALPHQFCVAMRLALPAAWALVALFLMTELRRFNCAALNCRAPRSFSASSASEVVNVAVPSRFNPAPVL